MAMELNCVTTLAKTEVVSVGTYVQFVHVGNSKSGKTKIFWVTTKEDGATLLGQINWYGPWRKYSFFPKGETIFESTCLKEITFFLDQMNAQYRALKLLEVSM